jgi:hypothetical protein
LLALSARWRDPITFSRKRDNRLKTLNQ